jgi:hypothetical protein
MSRRRARHGLRADPEIRAGALRRQCALAQP